MSPCIGLSAITELGYLETEHAPDIAAYHASMHRDDLDTIGGPFANALWMIRALVSCILALAG